MSTPNVSEPIVSSHFRRWAEEWRDKPADWWRVVLVLLAYLGGLVLVILLANLLLVPALKSSFGTVPSFYKELLEMSILGLSFALGSWGLLRARRALHGATPSLWAVSGAKFRWADVVLSDLVWWVLFLLAAAVTGLDDIRDRLMTYDITQWALLAVIALATFSIQATSEELAFRGYLLPLLASRASPIIAVLVSTTMFTVGHPGSGVYGTIGVAAFALMFSLCVLHTATVSYAAGAHVANNMAMFLLFPTVENDATTLLDLTQLVVALIIWFLWVRYRHARRH